MEIIRMGNKGDKKIRRQETRRYRYWRTCLFALTTIILLAGCSREDSCNTPFGEGAQIDIYMPDFASLQNVGGTVTVNRGHKGIFVRRISYSEFVAFECACPNDHEVGLQPLEDWNGEVLKCPSCGSMYETINGQPLEGAASGCPLYEYYTSFDGYILTVY